MHLVFLMATSPLGAQSALPVAAGQHQNQAASLLLSGELEAALQELEAAAALYKSSTEWEQYFSCLNQITSTYLEMGQLEDAKRMAKKALWESIEKLGRDNNEAARAAHKLGEAYSIAGRHESALESHRLGLMIRRKLFGENHPELADSYDWIAKAYIAMQAYDKAEEYFQKSRALRESVLGKEQAEVATSYYLLGDLAATRQESEAALNYHQKALAIRKKSLGPNHPDVVQSLARLGALYEQKGDQKTAGLRYAEAVAIWRQGSPVHPEAIAGALNFLAATALENGQLEAAIQLARQASVLPERAEPSSSNELGAAFLLNGAPKEAIPYFEKAIRRKDNHNTAAYFHQLVVAYRLAGLPLEAGSRSEDYLEWVSRQNEPGALIRTDAYLQRGYCLLQQGAIPQALDYLEKGLRDDSAPAQWKQEGYLAIGEGYRQQRDQLAAIQAFRQAIEAGQQQGAALFLRFEALLALAEAHSALASQDRNTLDNLEAALEAAGEADKILEELCQQPLAIHQLQRIQQQQRLFYELAIQACFSLNQQNQQLAYRQKAFYFAERSKQLDLCLPLLLAGDINFFRAPAPLLEEEAACRRLIPSLSNQLEMGLLSGKMEEQTLQELEACEVRYETVLEALRRQAPIYVQLKYHPLSADINALEGLLNSRNALLYAYFFGKEHLYIFFANGKELLLFRHPVKEDLASSLSLFSNIHQERPAAGKTSTSVSEFPALAYTLFRKLFPIKPTARPEAAPPQLCILPHGPLELFPFESLLTEAAGQRRLPDLPYLGAQYHLTYNYSANALMEASYEHSIAAPDPFQAFLIQMKSAPKALPANTNAQNSMIGDFDAIAEMWVKNEGGKIWEGGPSGERTFRQMPKGGALMIALPTVLTANPLDSYLILSPAPDTLFDNLLNLKELYGMEATAELAFFSSLTEQDSSTTSGWAHLAQALAYSGCNSLVLHRWGQPGPPSEGLLQSFLDNYQSGATLPVALQAARQAYLRQQESMPEKAHPYYWAGYMHIGAPIPIRQHLPISPYFIVGAVGVLILIGWWARR